MKDTPTTRRFRCEHRNYVDNPTMIITVHEGPYDKKTILSRTKWDPAKVTVTDITVTEFDEEVTDE